MDLLINRKQAGFKNYFSGYNECISECVQRSSGVDSVEVARIEEWERPECVGFAAHNSDSTKSGFRGMFTKACDNIGKFYSAFYPNVMLAKSVAP